MSDAILERRDELLTERDYQFVQQDAGASASFGRPAALLRVRVEAGSSRPEWFVRFIQSLSSMLELPPGWDSYGAMPVEPQVIQSALTALAAHGFPPREPALAPTSRGGVQLEWDIEGFALEIEFDPDGSVATLVEELDGTVLERTFESWRDPALALLLRRVPAARR